MCVNNQHPKELFKKSVAKRKELEAKYGIKIYIFAECETMAELNALQHIYDFPTRPHRLIPK